MTGKERHDDIGFGGLVLIQDPSAFCYGVDAVLLADFSKAATDSRVVDLGTGTGIIPLIISHKTRAGRIVGVELQPEAAALARRNVAHNGLSSRIEIINSDILELPTLYPAGSFDTVVSNPPYMARNAAIRNDEDPMATARHESTADLEAFIRTAAWLLRSRGSFYLVHRPARLADIIALARKHRLEPKRMRLVHPSRTAAPNILLLECIKDGGPELRIDRPLFLRKPGGGYTAELLRIYGKEPEKRHKKKQD